MRIDATGTVHPVGRQASIVLRARAGEWRLAPGPRDVLVALSAREGVRPLRIAGQVRVPGGLCDVVAMIMQGSLTGELFVYEEDAARTVYFEAGQVVGATTNVPTERLGEILWRFGAVTREQHDQIVRACEKTGRRIGDTAVELEFVEPDELYRMMARQVEEVFYAAVHVSDAAYYLLDGFDEKLLTRRHHLNTGHLLMEAARRMDEMHFFREKIPSDAWVPVVSPAVGGKKVPPDLADLFAECDGRRSIAEIGRRTSQLEFEVTRGVFQLLTAGLVTVVAPRAERPLAVVELVNRALVAIQAACATCGTTDELRDGLEQFVASTGTYVPLFQGAGPLPDGSLRADRLEKNARTLAGEDAAHWLAAQLLDYVAFALFHAGSLIVREDETALKERVTEMLKPLRQQLEGSSLSEWKQAPSGAPPSAIEDLR